MKMMKLVVAGAALLGSTAAFAGATGNVGAFSSYMFRGVDQGSGAAVQGGIDYSTGSGIYVGTWVSNLASGGTATSGAYETDIYGGWTGGGFDIGAIWYGYRDAPAANFVEVYAGYSAAGFSGKLYFSPEFGATEDEGIYATASYAIALSDTLALTPQVGFSTGDGVEGALGGAEDSYADYSVTLTKTLKDSLSFSLGLVGNSEEDILGKEQLVVSFKKGFDL